MTTTNLGKVAVVPKGEYSSTVQYERLDIVQYERSSYLVKQAVIGVTPTDGANYALLAGKGDSSYDVAVNNGFIGTEAEWKLYLKSDGSIQALQQFMTNDAVTEVSVPDYGNIPSLQGYISTMFENGGLPAEPFATKALMEASELADGSFAMVTNDVGVDNGLYTKIDGIWVKSEYDPLLKAKDYTDSKTEELNQIAPTTLNAFSVADSAYNVAFAVANDGVVKAGSIKSIEINSEVYSLNNGCLVSSDDSYAFSISDKSGNTALAILNDGTIKASTLTVDKIITKGGDSPEPKDNVKFKGGDYRANINHLEIYGQSLSQGAYSTPLQTTTQKYDSLMFTGGIRPEHPHDTLVPFYEDFIPLVEAASGDGYVGYETPVSGAAEAIKQLIKDENGISHTEQQYQILGTASGNGGLSLHTLSTTSFDEHLKPSISNAYSLCQQKGLIYAMPLMGWAQGEQDNKPGVGTGIDEYNTNLEALRVKVDSHLKTLNQSLSLDGFIAGQLCSFKTSGRTAPHIELAIYKASVKPDNNIYLSCPFYIFDYKDGFHVDGVSSKVMGAYMGLVYKRVVIDKEKWYPIHPIGSTRQGRVLEVKFHVPVQPLVFDTDFIAENTNYGFILVDSSEIEITLTDVKITQPDTVRFTAFDDIPEGCKLRYAWTPAAAPNRSTGPRGNMRDSQGDSLIFDPDGVNKPMHNWTPIFEYEV